MPAGEALTETQRSKRLTDAYAEAEPMCKWPAVNGVVRLAIRSGKYDDDAIGAALLRLAAEGRSVTVDSLRTEIEGFHPRERHSPQSGRSTGTDRAMQAVDAGRRVQQLMDEGKLTP